jgi:ABC-2 type transport system permease protein
VLLATIGYAAYNGAAWVRFENRTLEAAAAEEQERLESARKDMRAAQEGKIQLSSFLDPRNPSSLGRSLGVRYAILPPAPLAAVAVGQSDIYPYYVKVSTAGKETFLNNEEIENPLHLLSGRFDLAFVILYLYPLLILALSYNLLSEEKESRTLAMTLSQPVSLWGLVAGKIAFRFSAVVVLAAGLSIAGVVAAGADLTAPGALARLALWMAVVAAYGAFWFALAVAVNGWGFGSATNAMILAGAWLGLVLVTPSLLNVTVKVLHPVPSRVEMIDAIRIATREASAKGSALLGRYFEDHPELAAPGVNKEEFDALSFATQEEIERAVQPILAKFDIQLNSQEALVNRYRFLSPAILTQTALNDVAGTGVQRYRHFLGLTNQFHQAWRAWFVPKVLNRATLTAADIDHLPVYAFREEQFSDLARRVLTSLAALLLPTLLLAYLSYQILRRYSVAS